MDPPTALMEFLEYVIGQLIDHPEEASIGHELDGDRHVFRIKVHPEDMGVIIGKSGYTISSIRSLLEAAAAKLGTKVVLKVVE
ncbi:MAG: KH domain-containing protein [Verrucomicrobiota bacterium]